MWFLLLSIFFFLFSSPSLGHSSKIKFHRVSRFWHRLCTDVAQQKPTKLYTIFGRLLGWYTILIQFRGLLLRYGIFPFAKFTLCLSLALSYIGSVTARHSSSGRQLNFAALSRGRHVYSAGRPSRWAHILVCFQFLHYRYSFLFGSVRQIKLATCQLLGAR